jgi:hypothetical protein
LNAAHAVARIRASAIAEQIKKALKIQPAAAGNCK